MSLHYNVVDQTKTANFMLLMSWKLLRPAHTNFILGTTVVDGRASLFPGAKESLPFWIMFCVVFLHLLSFLGLSSLICGCNFTFVFPFYLLHMFTLLRLCFALPDHRSSWKNSQVTLTVCISDRKKTKNKDSCLGLSKTDSNGFNTLQLKCKNQFLAALSTIRPMRITSLHF